MTGPKKHSGFTLIEVLLALAIGGTLMTAIMVHVFSLSNIWMNSTGGDFFKQHVDGVTLFLRNALSLSEGLNEEEKAAPVNWDRPPGYSDLDEPLLTFRLKESPALYVWDGLPRPAVTSHIYFRERDGLSLLWYSRLDEVEDLNDVHRTHVSPYITEMTYCYYDRETDNWDLYDKPEKDREGQYLLPDFIKLKFEYEGEVKEIPFYLPPRSQDVPIF